MIQQKKKPLDGTYKMPFGKHKGEKVEDVPTDYLEWLEETLEPGKYNNDAFLVEIRKQLAVRQGEGIDRTPVEPVVEEPSKKGVMFKMPKKETK